MLAGCEQRYAAASNQHCPEETVSYRWVLDQGDQNELREAFEALALGHQADYLPGEAGEGGVRWSDVPAAVLFAADEVEMAIVRMAESPEKYEFDLKTIEDYPASLIVFRRPAPEIYEASATVGLYGDRTDRAKRLIEELRRQMKAFGRKRKLEAD